MNTNNIIKNALKTIEIETNAVAGLASFIHADFVDVINIIAVCTGRLIVSGIGKSGVIAQKIVSTLNSTGTPSIFMHAADAIHGDLGMVQPSDIVLIISKSGDSQEIKALVPFIKNFGNIIIGMVGNTNSFLAKQSHYILNTTVAQEACPNNLAPTASTTAQLAMGDALAVCLMDLKGFKEADFAQFHPGGTLGKKLYLKVGDLIINNEKPQVLPTASIKEVIVEITKKRLGTTVVINSNNEILGIITDGDLRRMLEKSTNIDNLMAQDIMSNHPQKIDPNTLANVALLQMQKANISQLVVEENGCYAGIIHLHDLVKEGII